MKGRLTGAMLLLGSVLLVLLTGCGNLSPVASFTCSPSSGHSPLRVSVDASASHDSDGTIVTYQWDFGDGGNGTSVTASHTYTTTSNHTYSITLTVTDDSGAQATDTHAVSVTPPPPNSPPVASFTRTPSSGEAPLNVSFDASASYDPDGSIVSYVWSFGDGNSGTGVAVSHTYTAAGIRLASLTVTDNNAARKTVTHILTITSPAPTLLEILDWQLTNDGNLIWPWVVVGHARNVSGHALSYAEVRANFYDGSGVMLNNWIDNVLDLPSGVTWEFNIRCIDSDVSGRVDHATVSVGTCH